MLNHLFLDIETYSDVDLKLSGKYNYIHNKSFEILLCSYALNDSEVQTIVIAEAEPFDIDEFIGMLLDPNIIKVAHNAAFEIECFEVYFNIKLDITMWRCTMALSAYCGLPLQLKQVANELDVEHKKVEEGSTLIKTFSNPRKPTKNNPATRTYPADEPEKWKQYIYYNQYDVLAERDIFNVLNQYAIPEKETRIWRYDMQMNARGIKIDLEFVQNAARINEIIKERASEEILNLTGATTAKSVQQVTSFLEVETGMNVDSLSADSVKQLIKELKIQGGHDNAVKVLECRQTIAMTAGEKYKKILELINPDRRLRNSYQYYGAFRTGRWAGRGVQLQNLKRSNSRTIFNFDSCRDLVYKLDLEAIDLLYDNPIDFISQLVRTSFVANDGRTFYISDYSSIESRVNAWLAGEEWKLEVFRTHGKIYEAMAARIFKVPFTSITKDSDYRFKGKITELGCGYGMGGNKFAAENSLPIKEAKNLVALYRKENPKIIEMWADFEDCAIKAVRTGGRYYAQSCNVAFKRYKDYMTIELPSGRSLFYYKAQLIPGKFGNNVAVGYKGFNDKKIYTMLDTYGGKLVENVVQSVARDLMVDAILRIEDLGYPVMLHTHDEVAPEIRDHEKEYAKKEIDTIMSTPPKWAEGLPIKGDGFFSKYYRKDD